MPPAAAASLRAVKRTRFWLLLFIAVLLPLRGAVAAAMLCGLPVSPAQHAPAAGHEAHHATHHGSGHHEPKASPVADKCNLCAASCCLTPLASAPPVVAAPLEVGTVLFPEVDAPPASFLSDGQERPPRSI